MYLGPERARLSGARSKLGTFLFHSQTESHFDVIRIVQAWHAVHESNGRIRQAGRRTRRVSFRSEKAYPATSHGRQAQARWATYSARNGAGDGLRLVRWRRHRIRLRRKAPRSKIEIVGDERPRDLRVLREVFAIAACCDVNVHGRRAGRRSGGRSVVELHAVPRTAADDAQFIRRGGNVELHLPEIVFVQRT